MTICSVKDCEKKAFARGWCTTHHKRFLRHGHLEDTRPFDWGQRDKHILYPIWKSITRRWEGKEVCQRWRKLFWEFVKDVGDKPHGYYRLERKNDARPWQKGNIEWKLMVRAHEIDHKERSEKLAEYQRQRRKQLKLVCFDAELRKRYNITAQRYLEELEKQGGVCKICGLPETQMDNHNKIPRQLAVDHCHRTRKFRGLLCSNCNTGLGRFKDDPKLIRRAIAYLRI